MNAVTKCILALVVLVSIQSQARTTVRGVAETSTRLTLESTNSGAVRNLFEAGINIYGLLPHGGYASMDQQVAVPRGDLISRIGHSTMPIRSSDGSIVSSYELYQMNLNFNFVDNDYALVKKSGKKILKVYGSMADELIAFNLDQVQGITCAKSTKSVCSIVID